MHPLNVLFDDYEHAKEIQSRVKTYPVDPLALAIHWLDGNLPQPSSTIGYAPFDVAAALINQADMSPSAFVVSESSLQKAQEIRDFYKQKYAYALMMGEEQLSPFQTELVKFLASDNPNSLNLDNVGMVISLPQMYEEDHKIFELMKEFVTIPVDDASKRTQGDYYKGKLTFSNRRTTKFLNSAAKHDYWFKNSKGHLFRMLLPMHTMESKLMDKVLDLNNNTIDFSGTVQVKRLFGNNFYYAHIFGRYDI